MKKFLLLFTICSLCLIAGAQSVDFEILGFADGNGNPVSSLVLSPTQDLNPCPILKNNGPNALGVADSVIIDITYNNDTYLTYMYLTGQQLHPVSEGEQITINPDRPIWSAAVMDEFNLFSCTLCYELRVVGHSVDPNPANNTACVEITRTVGIDDNWGEEMAVFPNPASTSVTLSGAAGNRVQIFDLTGRMLHSFNAVEDKCEVDIEDFASGLYLLHIQSADGTMQRVLKLVKQ